jgi:murein DD-endopeptidase MepM/ murein hydrolase activator NlpD
LEKKFKFTENPTKAKIVYAIAVVILTVSAIVVGIVAANSRSDELPPTVDNPPISDGGENTTPPENENNQPPAEEKTVYNAPVAGKVEVHHSTTSPVYSTTLEEWRLHSGIDIHCEENAPVFAAAGGTVSAVYNHPLLGQTVEITHEGGFVTIYRNLQTKMPSSIAKGVSVSAGDTIGYVGDTALIEISDSPHLHFEMKKDGESINPLSHIEFTPKSPSDDYED